uniref:DNA ligase ATP-dependent C-terminal domain-containing protein n=1 Tax=Hucho hucho TaxID=62062 RepID=A0A4W5RHJ6_9TELE
MLFCSAKCLIWLTTGEYVFPVILALQIGTGFKDEDLEQRYKFLKEHILPKPRPYYRVEQSTEPDVWLDAVQVWEVKCADLSLSPIYKAGMGLCDPEKGISLRFPRFLRSRDDKKPEDATSGRRIADVYRKQQVVQNQGDKADLEDYHRPHQWTGQSPMSRVKSQFVHLYNLF